MMVAGFASIATGLAAVALLGPLVTGLIDYRVTETLRNQSIALDLVSLAIVAPLRNSTFTKQPNSCIAA